MPRDVGVVALLAAIGVAALLVAPAGASSPSPSSTRSQLQQIQAREAQDRVQLNLTQATDNAVEAEVLRLEGQVGAEQAIVAADQSAAAAADADVASADQRLEALERQGQAAHAALVARAVDLYEHPFESEELLLSGAKSLNDLSDRQVLANAVQAKTSDLIDAVRAEQIQQTAARKDLAAAQAEAHNRHDAAVTEYGLLLTAVASQQQAHSALSTRINDDDSNLASLTGQDAALTARLNAESAQFAAQIAASGSNVGPFGGPVLGPVGSYGLQWPIHGVVTQEFGHNGHPGIDIAAPWGTPIVASGSGVVIYASWESGYGNYTCINHGGGISTCYGHQSYIGVAVGQVVSRGEVIGREGSTGHSTGPHVHFEVRVDGAVRNPRLFVPGNP